MGEYTMLLHCHHTQTDLELQWDINAYAITHRASTDITFNDVINQKVFFNVVKIIKNRRVV